MQLTTDDRDRAIKYMECLEHSDTILIGDDADLIVLCIQFCQVGAPTRLLYIYRPSSKTYVDTRKVIEQWPNKVLENIFAIHAASGCHIVSSLSGIGKTKLIKSAIKAKKIYLMNWQCSSWLSVIQALYCLKDPNTFSITI